MVNQPKVETVEEYLARGGKITVVPPQPYETDNIVRSTAKHSAPLMDLDEGAHFFSEFKERKTKQKKDPLKGIDLSKLPPEIRKLIDD